MKLTRLLFLLISRIQVLCRIFLKIYNNWSLISSLLLTPKQSDFRYSMKMILMMSLLNSIHLLSKTLEENQRSRMKENQLSMKTMMTLALKNSLKMGRLHKFLLKPYIIKTLKGTNSSSFNSTLMINNKTKISSMTTPLS